MPQYKLYYFNGRGAAEAIRQIFVYAGIPFEDIRIPKTEWTPEKKEELQLPWGQVPILEVDGVIMSQSFAIMRYLAKKFNLAGENEAEEFRCDEIVEAIRDVALKYFAASEAARKAVYANETEKFEKLREVWLEVDAPGMLKRFDNILEKGGKTWLVGNGLTYADILFAHGIFSYNTILNIQLEKDFPGIARLTKAIGDDPKLKEWLENRPKTTF